MGWAFAFPCSVPNVSVLLNAQASKMENDLEKWTKEVEDKRSQFYELNYFTTPQLLSLCEELGQFKCVVDQQKPINPEVMSLLQSITREVTASNVKEQVKIVCAIQKQSFAEAQLLGSSNTPKLSNSIPLPPQSNVYSNLTTQAMEYDIHHQRLEIHNDNNRMPGMSSMSRVYEDIMKAEVVSDVPVPQLKEEELTDEQKAIIANLKQDNGFHRKLIMLAFDRCAKPHIQEEVEEWCQENIEGFEFPDSEADMTEPYFAHSDDDDIPSEYMKEEEEAVKMDEDTPIESPPMETEPEVCQKPVMVQIIERIPVDENHPGVIKLHNTGFDLNLCIEAITLYPDDISLALDYLNDRSDQGKLFEASREESIVEDGGYGRQDSRASDISATKYVKEVFTT